MRSNIITAAILAGWLFVSGCASGVGSLPNPDILLVERYVTAYNDRDIEDMSELMHPEIQWLSIEGENIEVFADGKEDLVRQMTDYVASPAATHSELDGGLTDGRFVAVREIANWTARSGEPRQQSALVVYEIDSELIRRVWYYPSTQVE